MAIENAPSPNDSTPAPISKPKTPSRPALWWVILALVGLVIFVAAALLNPNQDRHFEEIDKIVRRRQISVDGPEHSAIAVLASYNNYFLFSTVTFGDNKVMQNSLTLSYGFFGTVKTTGNITDVMREINSAWDKLQKKDK